MLHDKCRLGLCDWTMHMKPIKHQDNKMTRLTHTHLFTL